MGQTVDGKALRGLVKGPGSMTEWREANSELKQSDIISFSLLKNEHEHCGDGLNPHKEKIQSKRRATCL